MLKSTIIKKENVPWGNLTSIKFVSNKVWYINQFSKYLLINSRKLSIYMLFDEKCPCTQNQLNGQKQKNSWNFFSNFGNLQRFKQLIINHWRLKWTVWNHDVLSLIFLSQKKMIKISHPREIKRICSNL